jgi:hypothetical protein
MPLDELALRVIPAATRRVPVSASNRGDILPSGYPEDSLDGRRPRQRPSSRPVLAR